MDVETAHRKNAMSCEHSFIYKRKLFLLLLLYELQSLSMVTQ
jgi:hypothetical protein